MPPRHCTTSNSIAAEPCWAWTGARNWGRLPDEPGGERAVLATVIRIGGTGHHVVAYQVVPGSHDPQRVFQGDRDAHDYAVACAALGPFETTTIAGSKYLVFVTPFG